MLLQCSMATMIFPVTSPQNQPRVNHRSRAAHGDNLHYSVTRVYQARSASKAVYACCAAERLPDCRALTRL